MKELIHRNILSKNPRKREVSIEEVCNKEKKIIFRRITSKYFVKDKQKTNSSEELKRWICASRMHDKPRNCHVLTKVDSKTGEYKVCCKILGTFYAIHGLTAYKIVYSNELRIQMFVNKAGVK
jgi:hypothetical protein